MKTSTSLFLTDILPHKRKFMNKIVKSTVFAGESPAFVFDRLKQAGVEGIELFLPLYATYTPHDIAEVKKVLEENTMPVLSVHQQLRFFTQTKLPEIEELFTVAKTLGAKVIVLHMSSAGKQPFDLAYVSTIHTLERQYGIKAGFENREKFFGSLRAPYGWEQEQFSELMKKNDFFITLDTTHLAQAGGDIITFFQKNKERIVNIHISDYKYHVLNSSFRPLRYKHMPLGSGELPIEEFLKTLHNEKYAGLVTMEIHAGLEGLCQSAQIINRFTK